MPETILLFLVLVLVVAALPNRARNFPILPALFTAWFRSLVLAQGRARRPRRRSGSIDKDTESAATVEKSSEEAESDEDPPSRSFGPFGLNLAGLPAYLPACDWAALGLIFVLVTLCTGAVVTFALSVVGGVQ